MKFTHKQLLLVLLAAIYSTNLLADPVIPVSGQKPAPLCFIENKGQVTDQDRKQRSDIQFSIKAAPGLAIFIGNGAIHYQFSKAETSPQPFPMKNRDRLPKEMGPLPENQVPEATIFIMDRMDVELIGANKNAQVITEQKQDYYENYFTDRTGDKSATAFAFSRITYKNIYPNIDWVLYTTNGQLEHEFVIRQGGKVSDIKLKYGGATELKLNEDGSFTAKTPQGVIKEHAPDAYQNDGKKVSSGFVLNNNVLSYSMGGFNGDLIIDPTLVWATYYGGSNQQYGNSVATDVSGNVYLAGYTGSLAGIATTGAYQIVFGGHYDAFLAKFSSSGAIQWATYYGGSGNDIAQAVATNISGDIYLCGLTSSSSGIATSGVYQPGYGGSQDAFLVKFSNSGAIQWGTYFGGYETDGAYRVSADSYGNVFIAGATLSPTSIATAGAFQTTIGGMDDAFVAKFSSSGSMLWATYYGGSVDDYGISLAVDGIGNVFLCGGTNSSSGIATPGSYQSIFGGSDDGFMVKFNGSGTREWATYFGGSGGAHVTAIATDNSGNVFLTGETGSTSAIATPGAYQATFGGGTWDAYLAKFNNSGVIQWATYYGGSGLDIAYNLATDSAGNPFISGMTTSSSAIATVGAYQTVISGGEDAFLAKFNTSGAIIWASYYGGNMSTEGLGIAAGTSGIVYLCGSTNSTSSIATPGSYQSTFSGDSGDAYLAKFNFNCVAPPSVLPISGPSSVCVSDSISLIDATPGGIWSCSNTHASVSGGTVSGISAGIDTISYIITNSCGTNVTIKIVTINTVPSVGTITGVGIVCPGDSIICTDATPGGVWSAGNTHATVTGGIITGVTAGIDTIFYTVTNICGSNSASKIITVNPMPSAGVIMGSTTVCLGDFILLTDASPGGIWSSSNPAIATISGGLAIGVSLGTDTISYTVTNSCGTASAHKAITVITTPYAGTIVGSGTICPGDSITLTDTVSGGIWSSSNVYATVTGGVTIGVSSGIDTIYYTVTNACGSGSAFGTVTINSLPSAGAISGPETICPGDSVLFTDDTSGGIWSSSAPSVALAGSGTGIIIGITTGTVIISYTVTNSCGSTVVTFPIAVDSSSCNTKVKGIRENDFRLFISPNPNSGAFTMNLISSLDESVHITITNVIGQKIKEFTTTTNKVTDIQMGEAAGIYLLNATTSTGSHVAKMVIN